MSPPSKLLLPCLTLLLVGASAQSCSERYWLDRGRDLGDCFLFSAHVGFVGDVGARVGPFDTGLGYFIGVGGGKAHWWHYGEFVLTDVGAGVAHLTKDSVYPSYLYERTSVLFLTPPIYSWSRASEPRGGVSAPPGSPPATPLLNATHWAVDNFFSVEVGAHFFIGARFGFNVAEFADFAVGWFGLELIPPFDGTDEDRAPSVPTSPDGNGPGSPHG